MSIGLLVLFAIATGSLLTITIYMIVTDKKRRLKAWPYEKDVTNKHHSSTKR